MAAPQSPISVAAASVVLGASLGVLFVTLLVATGTGPLHDLALRPEALLPMLLLTLNMSGLLACATFATALGQREREPGGGRRVKPRQAGARWPGCVAVAARAGKPAF